MYPAKSIDMLLLAIVHHILCLYDLYFLVYLICIPYVTS